MDHRKTFYAVPFYYLDDQPELRKDFITYMKGKDGIVFREFNIPEKFTEDIRRQGIEPLRVSIFSTLCYNPEKIKNSVKNYCKKQQMNLIEVSYPSMAAENQIIRSHMEGFYGMEIDFHPLADFRRLKSLLKPFL